MPEIPIELPEGVQPWASDEGFYDLDDDSGFLESIKQLQQNRNSVVRDASGGVVRVPKSAPSAIIGKTEVIKGERSLSGLRSYWLLKDGQVMKSVVAYTDEDADTKLEE